MTPSTPLGRRTAHIDPFLPWYDFSTIWFGNAHIWKCPTARILSHYNAHISDDHLDIGVGTGYFLDQCRFPSATPRVTLLDVSRSALDRSAQRLQRYAPQLIEADICQPLMLGATFDSISLTYVLHCLPGPIARKGQVLGRLRALLRPGGVLFGATLLSHAGEQSWLAAQLMHVYNTVGIFANRQDTPDGLARALGGHFRDVSVRVVGGAGIFVGYA